MATVTVQLEQDPTSAYGTDTVQQKETLTSKWGTDDKGISRGRLRTVIIIMLAVSALFQFIAMTAPGWIIKSYDSDDNEFLRGVSVSSGIFYSKTCMEAGNGEVTCTTKSHLESYRDGSKICGSYHIGPGRTQAGATLSWIFTLVSLVLLMYTRIKKMQLIHTGFILGLYSGSCIIMGELIFVGLVNISFSNQAIEANADTSMKFGFPYCVFFYILACVNVLASCVMVFKCFHDDVSELNQRISQQEVVIGTEKRHVDHLRNRMHREPPRSSPRHSPTLRDKHLRPNSRNSPRHSPRVSREVGPSPRASPRPTSREHQTFYPPSPRNSFDLRDYDRSSPRPQHDRHSERSRDHDRRDNRPRDHDRREDRPRDHDRRDDRPRDHDRRDDRPRDHDRRDDRSRDNRDHKDRPRHSGDDRPRSHRDERPHDHHKDRPRDRPVDGPQGSKDHMSRDHCEEGYANMRVDLPLMGDANKQNQAIGVAEDNIKYNVSLGDYQSVPVNSDSETTSDNPSQLAIDQDTININTYEIPTETETDVKDVNTVIMDV